MNNVGAQAAHINPHKSIADHHDGPQIEHPCTTVLQVLQVTAAAKLLLHITLAADLLENTRACNCLGPTRRVTHHLTADALRAQPFIRFSRLRLQHDQTHTFPVSTQRRAEAASCCQTSQLFLE
jgi:hypothetical protein